MSPASMTPPPITNASGSSAATRDAQSAPNHCPVVLNAAIATVSPSWAAAVIWRPVIPSMVPSPRANKFFAKSGDA